MFTIDSACAAAGGGPQNRFHTQDAVSGVTSQATQRGATTTEGSIMTTKHLFQAAGIASLVALCAALAPTAASAQVDGLDGVSAAQRYRGAQEGVVTERRVGGDGAVIERRIGGDRMSADKRVGGDSVAADKRIGGD